MKLSSSLAVIIIIAILIIAGFFYFEFASKATAPTTATSTPATVLNSVSFSCDAGKTIIAAFMSDAVSLTLSDGRTLSLPQTISGSGIRYEATTTPNEDIVFSSKGDNAMIMENNSTTYSNCVANASAATTAAGTTTNGTSTFTDRGRTFTFNYPSAFTVTGGDGSYAPDWMTNSVADGLLLAKLTVPGSVDPKTNFVDATFTVGTSPNAAAVKNCLVAPQSGGSAPIKSIATINGVSYTKFVSNDAGAGNFYETTSYRALRNSQCYAMEYTIHSSNIANYPTNSGITAFDQSKIESVLTGIVSSFTFLS
jgi:membrane-bound inhibitor of C-type lysozyme